MDRLGFINSIGMELLFILSRQEILTERTLEMSCTVNNKEKRVWK
jgi:hypothetical protein